MVNIYPEYIVDEKQKRKAVLLSLIEWDRIVEDIEELDDIRAYDSVKEQRSEAIPFEQAVREIQTDGKA